MSEHRRFRTLFGLGFVLLAAFPCVGQGGCGLDSRNLQNQALPAVSSGEMSPAVAMELRRGYGLISQGDVVGAELVIRRTMTLPAARENRCAEALALFARGQIARQTQLSEALPLFRRSEEILSGVGTPLALAHVHERIATTEHLVGDNAAFLRDDPAVQKEFHDGGDEARSIMDRSLALQYAGNGQHPDEQRGLLHELEAVHTLNVTAVRGFVEWETGSAMRRSGRYNEILALFQASLSDLKQCDCEHQTRAAVLLTIAAASDSTNDADAVLEYAAQADSIYRRYGLETQRPQALRLMGGGYARRHEWAKSIATYEEALRLARQRNATFALASTGEELAAVYGDSGNPLKGLEVLQRVEPAKLNPEQSCSARARRAILEEQARLPSAAVDDGSGVLADCKALMQPSDFAVLTFHYAAAQLQLGHTEEAATQARESVCISESQRIRLASNDRALRLYNEQKAEVYSVLIAALVRLQKPEEALLASEQYRARAFVDLASGAQVRKDAGPPPGLPGHSQRSAEVIAPARGEHQLPSEPRPFDLTLPQIRESLEKTHSTLVSYWLSEDGHLYTWIMRPGKAVVEHDREVDPVRLADLVRATLPEEPLSTRTRGGAVMTRGGGVQLVGYRTRRPWQQLYELLIAPIAAELPEDSGSLLTIVPQGVLFQLSFPALMDGQRRYLVEHYAVNTAPSVGVLQVTAKNEAAAAKLPLSYVLLANPQSYPKVNGKPLAPLPGTAAEVRAISRELSGRSVTTLQGRQAGIDSLVEALPKATVLHFATHAVVSDTEPANSYLALDRTQRGGLLTTSSVYELHMKTNLVVLSACSTGRGPISGDGVAGLSRAFFYAGAASLVTTLWDVVDEPTARLMPRFYAGLVRGETRSSALRNAQLGLIDDLRHHRVRINALDGTSVSLPESPVYWAAFSLSGQP